MPATAFSDNSFRADWLVMYTPQPGTVFYVGYGARMTEPEPMRFEHLTRRDDAFFVKASYLFRQWPQQRGKRGAGPGRRTGGAPTLSGPLRRQRRASTFRVVLGGRQHVCRLMAHRAWAAYTAPDQVPDANRTHRRLYTGRTRCS